MADDNKQYQSAKTLIEAADERSTLFLSLSVLVELEWVLRSLYRFDKTTLITTFNQLLGTRELMFQDEDILDVALD